MAHQLLRAARIGGWRTNYRIRIGEITHFVDIAFREAMTGVDFPTYAASFKKWFGVEPPAPAVGFPGELR